MAMVHADKSDGQTNANIIEAINKPFLTAN